MNFDHSRLSLLQGVLSEYVLSGNKLPYHAIANAFEKRLSWSSAIREQRELRRAIDGFFEQELQTVNVVASDRTSASYQYKDRGVLDDFGEYGGEYEHRHPPPPGVLHDSGEGPRLRVGLSAHDLFEDTTTKAGQFVFALAFAGASAGDDSCPAHAELRAAYSLQLTIRVDDTRNALDFDCFEFQPSAMDEDNAADLPKVRSVKYFEALSNLGRIVEYAGDELDQEVRARMGAFTNADRTALIFQATAGDFMMQRLMRIRVKLDSIVGVRLVVPKAKGRLVFVHQENITVAVLVLELSSPLGEEAFAARRVFSKVKMENGFATVPDWTPNAVSLSVLIFDLSNFGSVCVCLN